MEDRIKRMESAIIATGLHPTAEPRGEQEDEKSSSDKIESQAELSNRLSNLVIDAHGSLNFIGSASGFSLFSPQGFSWISEKVGDKEDIAQLVRKMKTDYGIWGRGDADLWYPMPRSQHSPLPTKNLALQYVDCYFTTFNSVFPVVNQKIFTSLFNQQYSPNPPEGTAWYALLNAVLCLGSIRTKAEQERHTRNSYLIDYTSPSLETGVEYFRNATSCFHDLLFKEANLMGMQAMTLMLFITTTSPNPQPSYILNSSAGNLANSLGLHRSLDGLHLSPEEAEQRRNVFWVFYLMDKSISQNLGRPSIINDDDIAVPLPPKLPSLTPSPNLSGAQVYDIFQDQITLAIIASRIYSELYSASASTKSEGYRMSVRGKLDDHLQKWRAGIPVEIRPEHPITCSEEQFVPVIMMHFTYLDAVMLLHRPGHGYGSDTLADMQVEGEDERREKGRRWNGRVYANHLLCLAAARRSIKLLDTFNNNKIQNQYISWKALYYPLSASLLLFTNILSNPHGQHAASDILLLNTIKSFITHSVQPGTSFAATPTLSMFKEICGIATRFVERVTAQGTPGKRVVGMKRGLESENVVREDLTHSMVRTVSHGSLGSKLSPKTTRDLQSDTQAPRYPPQTPLSPSAPDSNPSNTDQDASTTDPLLNFAPFLPLETNQFQFDYNPGMDLGIYDDLFSAPTGEQWDIADMTDMTDMWMEGFGSEVWDGGDADVGGGMGTGSE